MLRKLFGLILIIASLVAIGFGVLYFIEGSDANTLFDNTIARAEESAKQFGVSVDWDSILSAYKDSSDESITLEFVTTGIRCLKLFGIVSCVAGVIAIIGIKFSLHIRELVTYYPTRTVFDLLQMRQLL